MTKPTQPTAHSDSELDEILATCHSDSCMAEAESQEFFASNLVQYCDCRVRGLKTALLQWADRRAEKLVVEARIDERYSVLFTGDIAIDEYENRERIAALKQQLEDMK